MKGGLCNQKRELNLPYLKNSFFSSSVFRVRLFKKFITSRKSFLIKGRYTKCLKIVASQWNTLLQGKYLGSYLASVNTNILI